MYKRHHQAFKDEILAAIKNDAKISEICAQHNLSVKRCTPGSALRPTARARVIWKWRNCGEKIRN